MSRESSPLGSPEQAQREAPYIGTEPKPSKGVKRHPVFNAETKQSLDVLADIENTEQIIAKKKHLLRVLAAKYDFFNRTDLTQDDFETGILFFQNFNDYIGEKIKTLTDEKRKKVLEELETQCGSYLMKIAEKIDALQTPASPEALASLHEAGIGMASNSSSAPRTAEEPGRNMSPSKKAKIEEAERKRKEELSSAEEYISSVVEDVLRKTMSLEDFAGPKHIIAVKIMNRIKGAEELYETSRPEQKKDILQRLDELIEAIKNEIKKLGENKPEDRTVESSLRSILDASIDTINAHKKKLEIENKPEKKREDKDKEKKEEEIKYEIRNLSELEVLLSKTLANPELTVTSTEREMIVAQVEGMLQKSTLEEEEVEKILTIITDIYGGNMTKTDKHREIAVAGQKIKPNFRFGDKRSLVTTLYGIFYNKKTSIQHQKEFEKREKERENPSVQEQHFSIYGSGSLLTFLEKIYSDPNIMISEQQKDFILQQTERSIDLEFKLIPKSFAQSLIDLELRIDAINSLIDRTLEKSFFPKIMSEQDRILYTEKYRNTASLLKGIRSILEEVQRRIDNKKTEAATPATRVETTQEVSIRPISSQGEQYVQVNPEDVPYTPLTPDMVLEEMITFSESLDIPEKIEKDELFQAWLHRIAEKKCRESSNSRESKFDDMKSIESWYQEYTDTLNPMLQIKELLANEDVFDYVFAGFTDTEEKKFARENMGQEIEWQMYLNSERIKTKINTILTLIENIKARNEEITKLEKVKREIEGAQIPTTSIQRLSGEAAFDVVHPENISKVADLTSFLNDIQENYAYYSNTGKNKNSVGYIRSMFSKYRDSRKKGIAEHVTSKIPWYKKLGYAISQYSPFGHELEDHEDVNSFERIINFLQSENLVPSENTPEEEASNNMHKLLAKLQQVKRILEKDRTKTPEDAISELSSTENSNALKDKLKKLYSIYVENMGRQTSFQKNINHEKLTKAIATKETSINKAKGDKEVIIEKTVQRVLVSSIDFNHFTQETQSMFALKKLSELSKEFEGAKKNQTKTGTSPNFKYFAARLQTISVDEETSSPEVILKYKQLSLEISQAYIALANKDKRGLSIMTLESMQHYENILNGDIEKDKKKEYLEAAIKLLTESMKTTSQPKNILREVRIRRFIDHFQSKLKELEQPAQ